MTKPGIWKHYKGGLYRVLATATDSTNGPTEGMSMVVYISLTTGRVNVRVERQFHERVWPATGVAVKVTQGSPSSHGTTR